MAAGMTYWTALTFILSMTTSPPVESEASAPAEKPSPLPVSSAATLAPPAWSREAVWYAIDVPRFHNGEHANDAEGTLPWTTEWPPTADTARLDRMAYGGDLPGLAARFPYLRDLGVNTLYLRRILGADENPWHVKTSVAPSERTDPAKEPETDADWAFTQSDRGLQRFIGLAHEQGFRVVLPVPSVTDERESQVRLLVATDRWTDPDGNGNPDDGVDGWVVTDPRIKLRPLWKEWRMRTKRLHPNVLLVVDVEKAPDPWLDGDTFDTAIGSNAGEAIVDFFTASKKPGALTSLAERLTATNGKNRGQTALSTPLALSSERRGRLLSSLGAPSSGSEGQTQEPALVRWRLATILQYFAPGAPMIIYGDEVGLIGGAGAAGRAPMWWPDLPAASPNAERYRADFASLVRWLNFRRGVLAPLRDGSLRVVETDPERGLLIVARTLPGDEVYLVLNMSEKKQRVTLRAGHPGQLVGMLSPQIVPVDLPWNPKRPEKPTLDIYPLREGGNRQFVGSDGNIPLWVDAQSVRIVLVNDKEPRRSP